MHIYFHILFQLMTARAAIPGVEDLRAVEEWVEPETAMSMETSTMQLLDVRRVWSVCLLTLRGVNASQKIQTVFL